MIHVKGIYLGAYPIPKNGYRLRYVNKPIPYATTRENQGVLGKT